MANITVRVIRPDGVTQKLGPLPSDPFGQVYIAYVPDEVGNFTLQMFFGGQVIAGNNPAPGAPDEFIGDYYQPSASNVFTLKVQTQLVYPTPTSSSPITTDTPTPPPSSQPTPITAPTATSTPQPKPIPTITIACESSTSCSNFDVDIIGNLNGSGAAISNAKILLSYSITASSSWIDLTTTETGSNGDFSEVWTPQATGSYLLKAAYAGNTEYSDVSKIVNFAVIPFEDQNVFSVMSNSTVTSLSFNSECRNSASTPMGPQAPQAT